MHNTLRVPISAALVVVALCLGGCTSVAGDLESATAQTLSAVRSAGLALDLDEMGSSTRAATVTTIGDALTEVTDAQTTVTELETRTHAETSDREKTLILVRLAADAIAAARTAAEETEGIRGSADDLDRVADRLSALDEELKAKQ